MSHTWVRKGVGRNTTLMSNFEYADVPAVAFENTDHAKRSLEVKRKTIWRNW